MQIRSFTPPIPMTKPPVSQEADGGTPFNAAGRDAARQVSPSGEPVTPQASQPASMQAADLLGVADPSRTPTPQAQQKPVGISLDYFAPGIKPLEGQPPPAASPSAQDVANANGQQVVDQYSGAIQRLAEEAYALAAHNALSDSTYVDRMLESGDKTQVDLAKKVIERNSEHFGAKSVEEYQAQVELKKAGDDPVKIELAQLRLNQTRIDNDHADRDWKAYKDKQKVEEDSEFDKLCDSVRKEYPKASKGDILHMARGRAGIDPQKFVAGGTKATSLGTPGGDRGGQSHTDQPSDSHLSAFGIKPGVASATERYLGGVGQPGIRR